MSAAPGWLAPPQDLAIDRAEVHVWRADLAAVAEQTSDLAARLSGDEVRRAERFVFPRDRLRFAATRAVLRRLLARYLGVADGAIVFGYTARGKPFLEPGHPGPALCFNLSHSRDQALYAFAVEREVGVDVEYRGAVVAELELAKHYFAAQETKLLEELPDDARRHAFFRLWTLKEAYLKATGEGIAADLRRPWVSLPADDGEPVLITGAPGPPAWTCREVAPAADYAGAVVMAGRPAAVHCWTVDYAFR
jgi:4'-phosphopantetheinyl transferase